LLQQGGKYRSNIRSSIDFRWRTESDRLNRHLNQVCFIDQPNARRNHNIRLRPEIKGWFLSIGIHDCTVLISTIDQQQETRRRAKWIWVDLFDRRRQTDRL
jgi:hypothetical protein